MKTDLWRRFKKQGKLFDVNYNYGQNGPEKLFYFNVSHFRKTVFSTQKRNEFSEVIFRCFQ